MAVETIITEHLLSNIRDELDIYILGFSAPSSIIKPAEGNDLVVISNISDTNWVEPLWATIEGYKSITIHAWSLGVVVTDRLLPNDSRVQAIAYNGVVDPFNGCLSRRETLDLARNLNDRTLSAFQSGMCGTKKRLFKWREHKPDVALDAHCKSLNFLAQLADEPPKLKLPFQKTIISTHDRIMKSQGQLQSWQEYWSKPSIHQIPETHWYENMFIA